MYIYLAGPMTIGNQFDNFKNAVEVADRVFKRGHRVFVPHLSFFWNLLHPNEYRAWLDYDFDWIRKCDAVLRIPGESKGADEEVKFAQELELPVFFGLEAFMHSPLWVPEGV